MRAFGIFPNKGVIPELHPIQWIWLFLNLQEDEKEEVDKVVSYLDYLASYWNPKAVKQIQRQREIDKKFGPLRKPSEELFDKVLKDITSTELEDSEGDTKK